VQVFVGSHSPSLFRVKISLSHLTHNFVIGLHLAQFFEPSLHVADKEKDSCAIISTENKNNDFDIF